MNEKGEMLIQQGEDGIKLRAKIYSTNVVRKNPSNEQFEQTPMNKKELQLLDEIEKKTGPKSAAYITMTKQIKSVRNMLSFFGK